MDGSGLSRWSRRVAAGRTRRAALATALGGVTLAIAGMTAHRTETVAKKKKRCTCKAKPLGERCTTNKQCCTNQTNRICGLQNNVGGPNCCGGLNAQCGSITDCCEPFGCASGRCKLVA
jgi:hypothetical protein